MCRARVGRRRRRVSARAQWMEDKEDAPVSFLKPVRMPSEICEVETVSDLREGKPEEIEREREARGAPSRRCCRTGHRGRSC